MANGIKYSLATTAELVYGCVFYTAIIAFGVSVIIAGNADVFFYIKLFGALKLFYLA